MTRGEPPAAAALAAIADAGTVAVIRAGSEDAAVSAGEVMRARRARVRLTDRAANL